MEENVALDSKKQRKFVKSIKGIQKLIKKNEKSEAKPQPKKKDDQTKPEKPFSMRLKDGKVKKNRKERGLVYLGHIPHGFYEHQMTQYFKQFGVVTNARVIKSKKSGNSKGFAFVEFKETSVAQIVAETMNNYLMGKRLIKAVYIPPEEQKRRVFRKKWNSTNNPASIKRMKCKKEYNADKDDAGDLKKARKLLANLKKTQKKLSELGINYNFSPVDVPEALLDSVVKKEKVEDAKEVNSNAKVGKKDDKKVAQNEKQNGKKTDSNKKDNVANNKAEGKKAATKTNKKDAKPVQVNEKVQKEKEKKLKDAGVKFVDEFISVGEEDSDDSCEFDSDEYEKMLEDDEETGDEESGAESGDEESGDEESGAESGEDEEDSEVDEEDSEGEDGEDREEEESKEEAPPPKKGKGKPPKVVQPVQTNKQAQKQPPQKQQVKKQDVKLLEVKRKTPQRQQVAAHKP